jgi:hypothetical protein
MAGEVGPMSDACLRLTAALLVSAWLIVPPAARVDAADQTFIDAPADAMAILHQARTRMGGASRLNKVSTLRLEGVRAQRSGEQFPFVDQLLLPDRYKTEGPVITHTIDGRVFWQRPDPADESIRTNARRNVTRRFTEQSLLYLLRAPATMPLRARIQSRTASTVTLSFAGPDAFQRSIVFDSATGLPQELFHDGTLTNAGASATVQRRLTIEKRAEQHGIQVPTVFRETIGTTVAQITVARVVVDGGVTIGDFRVAR